MQIASCHIRRILVVYFLAGKYSLWGNKIFLFYYTSILVNSILFLNKILKVLYDMRVFKKSLYV